MWWFIFRFLYGRLWIKGVDLDLNGYFNYLLFGFFYVELLYFMLFILFEINIFGENKGWIFFYVF